jgi:hypothetical protein
MIAPPGQAAGGAAASAADIQLLFAEARRRRRRRRMVAAAVILALAGLVATGLAGGGTRRGPPRRAGATPPAAVIAKPRAPRFTLPAAHLAWVDYQGELHIGNAATGTQHVVATFPSAAGGWFAAAAGHLFWLDFAASKNAAPIRDYNLATGQLRKLARGESVFASADGRHVYLMRSGTALTELRAAGSGAPRQLTVPAGWHLPFPQPIGLADGGITVIRNGDRADAFSAGLGIWYPRTGRLQVIGNGGGVIAGYTPRNARYSMLAWAPSACLRGDCMIKITNTATMATVTVRSPLHHGFTDPGAAFSPDGTQLAVFVRRASISSRWPNHSELALVSTRTGAVRVARAVKLETQEDAGWVLWLPGGRRLLAGALLASYAVDARTLSARPYFFFRAAGDHNIMDTPDINFSAVLLPPADHVRRPSRAAGASRAP